MTAVVSFDSHRVVSHFVVTVIALCHHLNPIHPCTTSISGRGGWTRPIQYGLLAVNQGRGANVSSGINVAQARSSQLH